MNKNKYRKKRIWSKTMIDNYFKNCKKDNYSCDKNGVIKTRIKSKKKYRK